MVQVGTGASSFPAAEFRGSFGATGGQGWSSMVLILADETVGLQALGPILLEHLDSALPIFFPKKYL